MYQEHIHKNGIFTQKLKCVEELGELSVAVMKDLKGSPDFNNIAEEIADVSIMLEQMIEIYKNSAKVNEFRSKKLARIGVL